MSALAPPPVTLAEVEAARVRLTHMISEAYRDPATFSGDDLRAQARAVISLVRAASDGDLLALAMDPHHRLAGEALRALSIRRDNEIAAAVSLPCPRQDADRAARQ